MKLSIITVAYNSANTIRDTMNSVFNQDYEDLEYIVVDGKSTDETLSIIQEYANRFNGKMKWISQKDNGIYDAMNKGLALATGDVVGIINSDDVYADNHVLSCVMNSFLANSQIGAITGNLHIVSQDLQRKIRKYSSKYCTPRMFRFGLIPAHPTFFVKRIYYEKWGGYNTTFNISGDFDLMVRFLKVHKLPYLYLDYDMVLMRIGGASSQDFRTYLIENNKNVVRACTNNGVYTNFLMVSFRYFFKFFHLIIK